MSFTLTHTAKHPRLPYEKVKDEILGKSYDLTLNFIGETRAKRINQETRGKTYIPNVLAFPLSAHSGEIYLTPLVAKREAKQWEHSYAEHVLYLYIHGLLHLKGYNHGTKMEKLEFHFLKKHWKKAV